MVRAGGNQISLMVLRVLQINFWPAVHSRASGTERSEFASVLTDRRDLKTFFDFRLRFLCSKEGRKAEKAGALDPLTCMCAKLSDSGSYVRTYVHT